MERANLKKHCLTRLDERAEEHPAGHQGKYAARYILRLPSGKEIELMFEKGPQNPANLWVERRLVSDLIARSRLTFRESPGTPAFSEASADGKARYGRHSALKSMGKLKHADLVCFRIEKPGDLDLILDHLAG